MAFKRVCRPLGEALASRMTWNASESTARVLVAFKREIRGVAAFGAFPDLG